MRVVTLLENETESKTLKAAHGLSLYIEVHNKKILFDIGPNNYYQKNAKKLSIDLEDIDYLIVSHGHYDHGSGISKLLKLNPKLQVYLSSSAFDNHAKQKGKNYQNIGIKKPSTMDRVTQINSDTFIADKIKLYADIPHRKEDIGDNALKVYRHGHYIDDDFEHEIYLVIEEEKNKVLFSGCSHNGIENIITTIEKRDKQKLTHVIGGFHYSHYDSFDFVQTTFLQELGNRFAKKDIDFYSCHCTGNDAYFELKKEMKTNLFRLKTGTEIKI